MINKSCIKCHLPLNGGVFRRKNLCPHCMSAQNPRLNAQGLNAQGKLTVAFTKADANILNVGVSRNRLTNADKMDKVNSIDAQIAAEIAAVRRRAAARKANSKQQAVKSVRSKTQSVKTQTLKAETTKRKASKSLNSSQSTQSQVVANVNDSHVVSNQRIKTKSSKSEIKAFKNQQNSLAPVSKNQKMLKRDEDVMVTTNPFLSALNKKATQEKAQKLATYR